MFDKLEDLLDRYDVIMDSLNDPDVVNDQKKFRSLMREQSSLAPIVEKYNQYKKAKQDMEDS
ncbi:MAG: PCRF domain-containing protein, partial [Lachnospiraceae bacterium]|nr:PCRF domain-containing protein [Lachnospiraceae bacterium]